MICFREKLPTFYPTAS